MRVISPEWRAALVPVFLAAQALFIHAAASRERPPAPPPLSRFPVEFDRWKVLREDPVGADIQKAIAADALLSRTYVETPDGALASLFVAWFQTQRASVQHSPKVCLPASGWMPEVKDEVTLDTVAGPITVNRYLVANGTGRAVVLYWFQMPRRVIADDWALAAKLWLVADAWRDKRTDTALVRVMVWSADGRYEAATSVATGFARELYPRLRESLPR
ncbi:MAG TPA: EpsI family protein [Bryobacteraceae bacterium]|nr:EpsI family protein [Bryobacteraceae bacterium]